MLETDAESTEKYSEYIHTHTHTCTHTHTNTHTCMNAEMPPLSSYTTGDYMNVRKEFKIYL